MDFLANMNGMTSPFVDRLRNHLTEKVEGIQEKIEDVIPTNLPITDIPDIADIPNMTTDTMEALGVKFPKDIFSRLTDLIKMDEVMAEVGMEDVVDTVEDVTEEVVDTVENAVVEAATIMDVGALREKIMDVVAPSKGLVMDATGIFEKDLLQKYLDLLTIDTTTSSSVTTTSSPSEDTGELEAQFFKFFNMSSDAVENVSSNVEDITGDVVEEVEDVVEDVKAQFYKFVDRANTAVEDVTHEIMPGANFFPVPDPQQILGDAKLFYQGQEQSFMDFIRNFKMIVDAPEQALDMVQDAASDLEVMATDFVDTQNIVDSSKIFLVDQKAFIENVLDQLMAQGKFF
jgi:hypothetical protein